MGNVGRIKKSYDVFQGKQIGSTKTEKLNRYEYITVQEAQRVCEQLEIRDWTKLKKAKLRGFAKAWK